MSRFFRADNLKVLLPIVISILLIGSIFALCRMKMDFGICGIFQPRISGRFPPLMSLKEGDKLFERMDFSKAASAYEKILEENPKDYEILWRISRCYSKWGIVEKQNRKLYIPIAIDYARRAIEVDGNRFEGHLYLAESLGTSLKYEGAKNRVRFIREIREEAEEAIKLNPDHYRAYLVLGMWHYKVSGAKWIEKKLAKLFFGGLPDAGLDEAVRNLRKSIELNPEFLKTHYELALIYVDQEKYKPAMVELEKAIDCPVTNKKERNTRNKAIALLEKLKKGEA